MNRIVLAMKLLGLARELVAGEEQVIAKRVGNYVLVKTQNGSSASSTCPSLRR